MQATEIRRIFTCAAISLGLLFDTAGLLRMAIFCAVLHEAGHIIVYIICTGKLPRIKSSAGGISLNRAQDLSWNAYLAVLIAGPIANMFFSALLFLFAQHKASYGVYFCAAVSFCTGIYNLLPFGMLDGARIVQALLPARLLMPFEKAQNILIRIIFAASCSAAVFAPISGQMRVTLFLAAGYLMTQTLLCRDNL